MGDLIKGFRFGSEVKFYDYESLGNLPKDKQIFLVDNRLVDGNDTDITDSVLSSLGIPKEKQILLVDDKLVNGNGTDVTGSVLNSLGVSKDKQIILVDNRLLDGNGADITDSVLSSLGIPKEKQILLVNNKLVDGNGTDVTGSVLNSLGVSKVDTNSTVVTLLSSGWVGAEAPYSQTVSVNGILEDVYKQNIIVSCYDSSADYTGVICSSQGNGTLIFVAKEGVPIDDLKFIVEWKNVEWVGNV